MITFDVDVKTDGSSKVTNIKQVAFLFHSKCTTETNDDRSCSPTKQFTFSLHFHPCMNQQFDERLFHRFFLINIPLKSSNRFFKSRCVFNNFAICQKSTKCVIAKTNYDQSTFTTSTFINNTKSPSK